MPIADNQKSRVTTIMNEIVDSMKNIFGDKLRQVILFGSYARGEQEEYSDMDIMVLVNLNDQELNPYNNAIADIMTDISIKYGVLPAIIDKNYEHFHHWVPFLPFYQNVKAEGVEFYAS
ncbi:MAG: nucleotidyltransferase domain-containing protein [Veillonellales bacterium]